MRLGTHSGGQEIISALSRSDGSRLVSQPGNAGLATSRRLPLWGLRRGQRHYWSVQTVDNGFLGSPFSAESSFVVSPLITEAVATPLAPDHSLDLPALFTGQPSSSPSDPSLSFTSPANGFSGTETPIQIGRAHV